MARGEAGYIGNYIRDDLITTATEAFTPEILKGPSVTTTINYVPRGVCACITPWNFPISLPIGVIVPALLAGNSVVFKPSEHTPIVGQLIYELFSNVLPQDVIQCIQGDGRVGGMLTSSSIDIATFVGSQNTGKKIMSAQVERLNPVILEMGGKDPMIVLPGADLQKVAYQAVHGSLRNSGQVCVSVERVYVTRILRSSFYRWSKKKLLNIQ